MIAITAHAPTRLDFGGGWTDVPPYSDEEGGFVCNVAITRRSTVTIRRSLHDGAGLPGSDGESALARAAARVAALTGVEISIRNDFPFGAGLGGSSAAGVAMAAAIAGWRTLEGCETPADAGPMAGFDRSALAEQSRRVEVEELGIAGGRQDHYAAAYGGALALTFGAAATDVHPIALTDDVRSAIARRCVVIYTGQSRISGDTITAVLDAYRRRERTVLGALGQMKRLAGEMATALGTGDLDSLGVLVDEHWTHQRSLHPAIPTPLIDEILARGRAAGALGGKALGASGGGCVLLVAPDGGEDAVRRAAGGLGELLAFDVDREGVVVDAASAIAQPATGRRDR